MYNVSRIHKCYNKSHTDSHSIEVEKNNIYYIYKSKLIMWDYILLSFFLALSSCFHSNVFFLFTPSSFVAIKWKYFLFIQTKLLTICSAIDFIIKRLLSSCELTFLSLHVLVPLIYLFCSPFCSNSTLLNSVAIILWLLVLPLNITIFSSRNFFRKRNICGTKNYNITK